MGKRIGILAALASLAATMALAQDVTRYADQGAFGGWTVTCDEQDDMGGILLFDCLVRSAEGVFFGQNASALTVQMPMAGEGDRLDLGAVQIELAACAARRCQTPLALAELAETGAEIRLSSGESVTLLPVAGLADALAEAARLVD